MGREACAGRLVHTLSWLLPLSLQIATQTIKAPQNTWSAMESTSSHFKSFVYWGLIRATPKLVVVGWLLLAGC